MPGYKTHLIGGLGAFFVTTMIINSIVILTPKEQLFYLVCSLIGSIFPDIDIRSKMQRLFFIVVTGALTCTLWMNKTSLFLILSACVLLVNIIRHRTITHQLSFLTIMPLFFALGGIYVYRLPFNLMMRSCFFFITGCLSHIILDQTQTKFKRFFIK